MFQEFALTNAEIFKELGAKKLVVLCPHGLTVFRNEYKRVIKDFDVEIISHVELLAKLVREGKLKVKSMEGLTFHDPCNLARFNGIIEEPRVILRKAGFVEMKRHGIDTFCYCDPGSNCQDADPCPYSHCYWDCGAAFHPAATGTFPGCTNGYGLFDINGNAWERVADGAGRGGAFNCGDSEALHRCDYVADWGLEAKPNFGFRCCCTDCPSD